MHYPRVIIIGETFRLKGGGGITLTNLFKEWPPENIGVATDLISLTNTDTKYSYYQLGREEIKFPFPFSLLQTYFESGPYIFGYDNNKSKHNHNWFSKLKKDIRPLFDNLLNMTGLFSSFYKIKLSESLKKWILDFEPDIIYLQPFYHHMMRFGNTLFEELKIPYAIHIMDDSVRYINRSLFWKDSIQLQIDEDFRKLVKNAEVRMCISEAMADEYRERYGKPFLHYRNPIVISQWESSRKDNAMINPECLRIIYTGRTYPPYFESVIDVCSVVDSLNRKNMNVILDLSPFDINPSFLKRIKDFRGVNFYNPVNSNQIPELIYRYNIFLICEDFDENARKYLHFSISTRASEGMISGVPVLIYAPGESALCKYFSKTDSGCIVEERSTQRLEIAILKLWNDVNYRKHISNNAILTAKTDSDSNVVRENFRNALDIITKNDGKT